MSKKEKLRQKIKEKELRKKEEEIWQGDSIKDQQDKLLLPKGPKVEQYPDRGVVYLGHIPYGFFEKELRGYFSQFGTITRLKLSRNKKTGHSKHYAFIEFEDEDVADIVVKSMDGYLLYNHILRCKRVPIEKLHPDTFKGANKTFKPKQYRRMALLKHNSSRNEIQLKSIQKRLELSEKKKRNQLKELGIDYNFDGYAFETSSE